MDGCIFLKQIEKNTRKVEIIRLNADEITQLIPAEYLRGYQGKIQKMGYMAARMLNKLNPSFEFSLIEK